MKRSFSMAKILGILLVCLCFLSGMSAHADIVLYGNSTSAAAIPAATYAVNLMAQPVQVVKGQVAEFVLKIDFLNGFSTTTGINFTVSGLPGGTVYIVSPLPLMRSGGVVVRINTATLPSATYNLTITSTEAATAPQIIPVTLVVTTTNAASIKFTYNDGTTPSHDVTSLAVTGQKSLVIVPSAVDSSGKPILELVLSSSDPSLLGVYKNGYGGYDVYTLESGSPNLVVTAPDGVTSSLPITITVPANQRIDISLNPAVVTNKNTDPIMLNTTFQITQGQGYGSGRNGNIVLKNSTLDFGPNPPPYYYGGQFLVDNDQTQLGTYMFTGSISAPQAEGGGYLYTRATPLTIVNDPSYAGLNLAIRSLDSKIMPQMYEMFNVEFYDNAGVKQFSKTHFGFSMYGEDLSFIGAIPPGSYKVRFVPFSGQVLPQWYPNADSAADAQLLTFTAGVDGGIRYMFVRPAPDTDPPYITQFTVPATATSLTVTGIILSAYDFNGIAGYCLTETNNAAGCTWLAPAPDQQYQYLFGTPGAKTLYAFAKDPSGNVSLTDATSTKPVTITLQYPLTLAFAGTGGGQVTGGINCLSGDSCPPVLFTDGAPAELTAYPDTNSTFGGWSGCTSVNGRICTVSVSAPKTVTVTMVKAPPVRIMGGAASGFSTLQAAYNAASASSIIQSRSITLADTAVTFDKVYAVTVKGGYDAAFSANAGISTVAGKVIFKGGPVTIDKLSVR